MTGVFAGINKLLLLANHAEDWVKSRRLLADLDAAKLLMMERAPERPGYWPYDRPESTLHLVRYCNEMRAFEKAIRIEGGLFNKDIYPFKKTKGLKYVVIPSFKRDEGNAKIDIPRDGDLLPCSSEDEKDQEQISAKPDYSQILGLHNDSTDTDAEHDSGESAQSRRESTKLDDSNMVITNEFRRVIAASVESGIPIIYNVSGSDASSYPIDPEEFKALNIVKVPSICLEEQITIANLSKIYQSVLGRCIADLENIELETSVAKLFECHECTLPAADLESAAKWKFIGEAATCCLLRSPEGKKEFFDPSNENVRVCDVWSPKMETNLLKRFAVGSNEVRSTTIRYDIDCTNNIPSDICCNDILDSFTPRQRRGERKHITMANGDSFICNDCSEPFGIRLGSDGITQKKIQAFDEKTSYPKASKKVLTLPVFDEREQSLDHFLPGTAKKSPTRKSMGKDAFSLLLSIVVTILFFGKLVTGENDIPLTVLEQKVQEIKELAEQSFESQWADKNGRNDIPYEQNDPFSAFRTEEEIIKSSLDFRYKNGVLEIEEGKTFMVSNTIYAESEFDLDSIFEGIQKYADKLIEVDKIVKSYKTKAAKIRSRVPTLVGNNVPKELFMEYVFQGRRMLIRDAREACASNGLQLIEARTREDLATIATAVKLGNKYSNPQKTSSDEECIWSGVISDRNSVKTL